MVEVVKIGAPFLGKIIDYLVDPIKRQFTYMCCFNNNITELETQLKELETTRQGVQMGVDENRRKVRVVGPNVEAWRTRANEVTSEVEEIIQDKAKVKEGCWNVWCPNLILRYSLSKKAVKKTKVVADLKADGNQYTQSSYSPLPACLETISNRDFMGFESRRLNMEEIIKALKDGEINLIGVCGMAGVGKTTLVTEVAKKAKEENHVDEVAMATVGQKPNLRDVQACIAEMLGLTNLRDTENMIVRADLLRRRLLQDNKKVLVILDDIWAEFDLKTMGIPLEGVDKNFKMLYASRTRDLWHDLPTKKEIPLEVLSKDEAWQLFREKAGDSADAPDLHPIAKQIVDECGCLPLALVLIGSALSKKSGRNYIKEIWKGMLDRLTCAGSTPADKDLSSRLALSYEYLEDEQAKRLFMLCCLFSEDEDIRIEDLARYGLGQSLFDGTPEMEKVRPQVFLIVDDLKSRYLLLDGKNKEEECVKVHDVVRDMGISIASKNKFALVSHGEISQWPKTATHEHYTAISVISDQIEELPEELTYRNLEFLMLRCQKLEKLPPNFFEGMEKLKVLELRGFCGILTLQFLRNLTSLSLEGFGGKLYNVSVMGDLRNLETLSFRCSKIKELPEEIGELVNLKLLDLRYTTLLARIPPGVISRLARLEEAYVSSSKFIDWEGEGEGKEEEVRNANLKEFGFLSSLNTLEIGIRSNVVIPKVPIFSKLKIYKVVISCYHYNDFDYKLYSKNKCERVLWVEKQIPTPSDNGGIVSLLSSDGLCLKGEGCKDLVQELQLRDGVNGLQQTKVLIIKQSDTPECLVNTTNPVHLPTAPAPKIFPILKQLHIFKLPNLREICCGPFPAGSFAELTSIRVHLCERLETLFHLPIEGCLTRREDVHVGTKNMIVFPKLESLFLTGLPSLVGFCRGIDQIDFPQLKHLWLKNMGWNIGGFNRLFHNDCHLSSNSEQNDILTLFPQMVSLPNLEFLEVDELVNLERLGHCPLSVGSLSKLKKLTVRGCGKLLCVIPSQFLPMLRELQVLTVESCDLLEVVLELEGLESNEPNPEILSPLKLVKLHNLPKLNCISKRYPMGFKYIQTLEIRKCNSLRCVFAPTMTKSIPQLRVLKISGCKMLSTIVGESSVDEVEFPQLESLELYDLPNLVSFFTNVNVNTTTVAKSTDHLHNPMQPQPLFNEKVAILCLEYLVPVGLQSVHDLWGSEFPTSSFSNLKNLQVAGCPSLRNFPSTSTQGLQEVAQLLYTDIGKGVLALGSNGTMMLWKWGASQHNPLGMATTSVLPQQWEPPNGIAMTNDVTSVNLEEAVPCMALSKNYFYMISACGGKVSLFNMRKFREIKTFMPPPPASTFLALYPQDNNIIAIGMEDSTIRIYNFMVNEVKSELKGHKKRITGLAFSINLSIMVSSGADAQLCIWSIDTWEHLKSVPIQLPADKAWNGNTRVQFHSDQIRLLVSHETQLAIYIYYASEMDRICQWVPQDDLPAPISSAAYSCDSQLVYTSFCDGNIGVFDAHNLMLTRRIAPSIYLSPAMLSGSQAVYPRVVAAHPQKPNQFAIGLTNGFVVLMEPQESEGKWGLSPSTVDNGVLNDRTASSSNTNNLTPVQRRVWKRRKRSTRTITSTVDNVTLNDRTASSSNTSNHTPDQFRSVEEGDSATSSARILPQASGSESGLTLPALKEIDLDSNLQVFRIGAYPQQPKPECYRRQPQRPKPKHNRRHPPRPLLQEGEIHSGVQLDESEGGVVP